MTNAKSLRDRAERLLRARPPDVPVVYDKDVRTLFHELDVYQTELEIQNEELRRIQIELATTRDRYADLYEFDPVGYLTLDGKGEILAANLTAAKILGTNREQIVGSPFSRFLSSGDADLLHLHLVRVFETDNKHTCDLQLAGPKAEPRCVRLESAKHVKNGLHVECRTIMSDVTELKVAQDATQRSQRLATLGTFAAGIAHEINNPLWMISLQAELALIAKDKPDGERIVVQCLNEIKQLVQRGGCIVKSVLRSAKEESVAKSLESLDTALRRVCDYMRPRAAAREIAISREITGDLPKLYVNLIEMEQVFINVLANAIDASPAGSRIRLTASRNINEVTVCVEDQGSGLSEEESKRIFAPFFTTQRERGGTGLGLSVAHQIMKHHDGEIEIVSRTGVGTIVSLHLPIPADQTREDIANGYHPDC